ncbi:alpha/beta hydrolase [Gymnodinialimonas hymeniacidonis]|uniref:alpha/beta hydrolase n=1 Tax=Gymnodinialimonas hymeniacidonis TaxID=3126508 RepID=UPI0034C5CB9E
MITDWDDAYANGAHIEDADAILARWKDEAPKVYRSLSPETILTGSAPRQFFDLYLPDTAIEGVTVFVHGGYWMAFEGRDFAHLVKGPLLLGQAVASVTYTLAPQARISEITAEITQAIVDIADRIDGSIRLVGHSAGGHLVTRLVCDGVLPAHVLSRIAHVVSISGVHDLRPLLRTKMNQTLGLTPDEAIAESPALLMPIEGVRVSCVVGAEERPEFRRQSALLANIWTGLGAVTQAIELPGENHFSIITGLENPQSDLCKLVVD